MNTHGSEIVERALTEPERYDGTYEEWLAEWDYAVDLMETEPDMGWAYGGALTKEGCASGFSFDEVLSKVKPFTDYGKANGLLIGDKTVDCNNCSKPITGCDCERKGE